MKRTILISLLLATLASAQSSPQLTFGSPVKGEMSATIPVNLSGSAGANIASLQFALPLPPPGVTLTITAGPASAQKTLACSSIGRQYCVIYGPPSSTLADGIVAVVLASATTSQKITETFSETIGASQSADAAPITAGPPLTLTLTSKCDLNSDGKTDLSDVAGALGQAQGVAACTTADLTGRGKCDVVDIQRIVNAAVDGVCRSGP